MNVVWSTCRATVMQKCRSRSSNTGSVTWKRTWAVASGMPMHILLTKADKLTYGAAKNTLLKVQSEIRKGWGDAVTIQLFSAPKRMGLEDAYTVLADWMELADKGAEAAE